MESLQSTIRQALLNRVAPDQAENLSDRPLLVVVPDYRRDGQTEEVIQALAVVESDDYRLLTLEQSDPFWLFVRSLRRSILDSGPISLIPSGESALIQSVALPLILGRFFGRFVRLDLRAPRFYTLLENPGFLDLMVLEQFHEILVNSPEESHWLRRRGINAKAQPLASMSAAYPVRSIERVQPRLLVPAYSGDLVNLTGLIKAFRLVKAKYPRAEMALLMLDDLSCEVDRLCRNEQVSGITYVDAYLVEDIHRSVAEADLFLNVSLGGDHAGMVTRALQSGLPIVSTDSVWARSFMERPDWYRPVDPNNPGELADVLIELIESPPEVTRLAACSRQAALRLVRETDH
ncbi:MAG TPA: hypothetical protein PLF13_10575 [candidate division Zixibacteria bacterium]|nr:hypothetical protein [candidate division Zixibacteria bacterium]